MSALVFAVLALTCAVVAVGLSINDTIHLAGNTGGGQPSPVGLIWRVGALLGLVVFLVLAIGAVIA